MDWETELSKPLFQPRPVEVTPDSKIARATPWYSGEWTYAIGYRTAADTLVERYGIGYPYFWETHIYPICYLYRHSVEIALKQLVKMLLNFNDLKVQKKLRDLLKRGHSLSDLWDAYSTQSDQAEQDHVAKEKRVQALMRERITEFDVIDPYSFSFRYATNRSGDKLAIEEGWTIDLANLKDRMNVIWTYLDGAFSFADALLEAKWHSNNP